MFCKYCYVSRTIQLKINHLFTHCQTILYITIQFSMSFVGSKFKGSNSSIWSTDRTLSDTTTLSQSGPGSNGNKRILCLPQSSSITRASPSGCLVSYPGHLLGNLTSLQRCSWCILQPQPTGLFLTGMLSLKRGLPSGVDFYEYCKPGGAGGVMVIITGYGHGDMSSNPGPDWLHFT